MVLVVVASITIAEPINSKFRRLPEGQVPQRAEHYRTLWRSFHAVRSLAALAALACLAAAGNAWMFVDLGENHELSFYREGDLIK